MVVSSLKRYPKPFSVGLFIMIDFDNFKINCSQIGGLMGNAQGNKPPTEVQLKKLFNTLGRDYAEMSEVMKFNAREILLREINYDPNRPSDRILSALILIYSYEMYGKNKVSKGNDSPHEMEKGSLAEPASIKFLSQFDGVEYQKNQEKFTNKWFQGIPDIIVRNEGGKPVKIIEVKTSYDLPSFIRAKYKPEPSSNIFELFGYMDMLGCKEGEIVHCLVDMPERIQSFEEKRLRERYSWLELDEETILDRIGRTLNNMEYSGIPDEFKIFRRPYTINKLTMKDVKRRATVAKKWIKTIHELFTENKVNLLETDDHSQEDNI